MSRFATYLMLAMLLSSCGTMKQLFHPVQAGATVAKAETSLQFIEPIEIKSADAPTTSQAVIHPFSSGKSEASAFNMSKVLGASLLESLSPMQLKYAIRMDVAVENISNLRLYEFIDEWWGTPYRLGGSTRNGIDCSAFVQTLMMGVFSLQLPRTSREQKTMAQRIDEAELREGDLVFFSTNRRGIISHVGIYLHNNKFVHASTSGGVMISDLNEAYWSRHYRGAGRVMNESASLRP